MVYKFPNLQKDKEFEDIHMKSIIEDVIKGYKFQTNIDIELDLKDLEGSYGITVNARQNGANGKTYVFVVTDKYEYNKNYTFLLLSYIESSPKDLESSVNECLSEISKFREHIKDQMISETLLFYAQLGLSLSLIGQTELSSKFIPASNSNL